VLPTGRSAADSALSQITALHQLLTFQLRTEREIGVTLAITCGRAAATRFMALLSGLVRRRTCSQPTANPLWSPDYRIITNGAVVDPTGVAIRTR